MIVHLDINNKQLIIFYTIKGSKMKIIFYAIDRSTLKRFILVDILLGTTIYYAIKMLSSNMIIATIGSIIGTEGIKKLRRIEHSKRK